MRVIIQPTSDDTLAAVLGLVTDLVPDADVRVGHGGVVLDVDAANRFLRALHGEDTPADDTPADETPEPDPAPVTRPAKKTTPAKKTAARSKTTRTGE